MEVRSVAGIWLLGGWALNFFWEIAHRPLYEGYVGLTYHLWGCFLASLGDVTILAGLFGFMAGAASSMRWFRGSRVRLLSLSIAGAMVAAAIEYRALYGNLWMYAEGMPMIPVLGLGLSPILQMALGPVLLALASRRVRDRAQERGPRERSTGS